MTTTTTADGALVRSHEDRVIPLPGTYDIDRAHSSVEFVARHLMISKVRGRFAQFSGVIDITENPAESSVHVTIEAASVETSEPQRDAHLRSPDFLDVEHHPTLEFVSTRVEANDDEHWRVTGDLTILGTTRPVELDVEFEGARVTSWSTHAVAFSASTEIDREQLGVTWNQALESGGFVVGKKIRIELNVEAIGRTRAA